MTNLSDVVASTVELLSIGLHSSESLFEFYTFHKDQGNEAGRVAEGLDELVTDFRTLRDLRSERCQSKEYEISDAISRAMQNCKEFITELQDEKEKIITLPENARNIVGLPGRQTTYSFRRSTLLKLEEDISEIRYHILSALRALQLDARKTTHDSVVKPNLLAERMNAGRLSSTICDWLKAPDAAINHITTYAKSHIGTGLWFTTGQHFANWLAQENSFLWLNGRAGCGKSVLCSTAIEYTLHKMQYKSNVGIAFFYFKFDDASKQGQSAIVRALMLQLAAQSSDCETDLIRLHASCEPESPTSERSIEYLQHMVRRFRSVYLFFDALDESRWNEKPESVLALVSKMREWHLPGLHLLVTSRKEPAIREYLSPSSGEDLVLENSGIKNDISNFIFFKLNAEARLRKWRTHHGHIQQALSDRAQGVFRYVEYQFDDLKRCPRTGSHLDKCLRSLPHNLDETYERILCSIDEVYVNDARRIFTLLCFSNRPLTVAELADAYAIDIDKLRLRTEDRHLDSDSIREICQGLVEISAEESEITKERANPIARIPHSSVQEYLESDRIEQQKAALFSLNSRSGHALLSQVCLIYLLQMETIKKEQDEVMLEFPLGHYAAESWFNHYEKAEGMKSHVDPLVLELFLDSKGSFKRWINLCDVEKQAGNTVHLQPTSSGTATPVYLASFMGLHWLLERLLTDDQEDNRRTKSLINEQSGFFGNALQAASYNGHQNVVQTLLDKGAHVNSQGGHFGNALQAASYSGYENVVQLLLNNGIDINIPGGEFGSALLAASYNGHTGVVQMLIHQGADSNTQLSILGNSLQVASWRGHADLVQILLENDVASVNSSGGEYGSAVQAAAYNGHQKVVQILLDAGAEINTQGGRFGYPLQAASLRGQEGIVQILLNQGASINAVGGRFGSALQAASLRGHEKIVQMLLERHADPNIQYGRLGNTLQAASWRGHRNVVQMLLENNARVNTASGQYGSALQAASLSGHEEVVQILLDNGADINSIGGEYGNALVAASYNGHEKIVQMLLHRGADVNAQVDCGNAFEAASSRNHQKVIQLLLAAGARN